MAISRQWRGKAICIAGFGGLSLHRRFPLQIDCIFWARVWDQIESRPLPIFLPSPPTLFWRSLSLLSWPRILYKHDLSSCPLEETKAAMILWFMISLLLLPCCVLKMVQIASGAGGEKNLGNLNWRIYEWRGPLLYGGMAHHLYVSWEQWRPRGSRR